MAYAEGVQEFCSLGYSNTSVINYCIGLLATNQPIVPEDS